MPEPAAARGEKGFSSAVNEALELDLRAEAGARGIPF